MSDADLDKWMTANAGALCRKVYPEEHPDAVWDKVEQLWRERDDVFRARIMAALDKTGANK